MATIENLSDDIFYLILEYLSPERLTYLQIFRLVSRQLKSFAESVLFRTVALGQDHASLDHFPKLLGRLLDENDSLSRNVRNFEINLCEGEEDIAVFMLSKFTSLRRLVWNVSTPMPDSIFKALHSNHFDAQLEVKSRIIDSRLFSSSHLYRLDISVPCEERSSAHTLSLFRRLKLALVQNECLRMLSISIHDDPFIRRFRLTEDDRGSLNIPLKVGEKLPPIRSFSIKAPDYDYNKEHCARLLEALDWSRIHQLSFGPWCPHEFFTRFPGHVPNLKKLEFGYCAHLPMSWVTYRGGTPEWLECAAAFISSVRELTELEIHLPIRRFETILWSEVIGPDHGTSLQHLSVNCDFVNREIITPESLNALFENFPYLRTLNITLPLGLPTPRTGYAWPNDFVKILASFSLLRDLVVSVRAFQNDGKSLRHCTHKDATKMVYELWKAFFKHDRTSDLNTLTLRFWRWEERGRLHTTDRQGPASLYKAEIRYTGYVMDDVFKIAIRENLKISGGRVNGNRRWQQPWGVVEAFTLNGNAFLQPDFGNREVWSVGRSRDIYA